MIKQVLENHKDYIVSEYINGKTMTKLGSEFNCNSGSIYYFLKDCGVETRKRQSFKGKVEYYSDDILRMYNDGKSCTYIATELNMSIPTVIRYLNKLGYDTSKYITYDKNNLAKDKHKEIIKLYKYGYSSVKIGELLGHSGGSIIKILRKHKVKIRPGYKHDVNVDFFDKIDTEYKAYAYGLLLADGSVNAKTGVTRIALKEDDKHILDELKDLFGYTGKLLYVPAKRTSKPQYTLNIARQEFTNKLIQLGCKPNKSLVLGFDSLSCVPDELMRHAIRGYLDGDGSIAKNYASICCTSHFAADLSIYTKSVLDIEGIFYYRKKGINEMGSWYLKKTNAKPFLDWIYKDANIYLKRKHNRYLKYYNTEGV